MSNVVNTVLAKMIADYPTLRASRLDALLELSCKAPEYRDEAFWDADGNIVLVNVGRSDALDTLPENQKDVQRAKEKCEEAALRGSDPRFVEAARKSYHTELLNARRDYNEQKFVRDNADLLADENYSRFVQAVPSSDAFRLCASMPENANPLWVAAFVELAEEVLRYKFPAGKFESYTAEYRKGYESRLATAQQKAQAFLIRVRGTDTEKRDLAKAGIEAEIAKLRQRAEAAGITLEATLS